jgi:flagellar hook-associated protein 3 FlgL
MRISTGQMYDQAIKAITDNQVAASRTQIQLATGRRIVAPSDDPAGSQQLLDLTQLHDEVSQYQTNAKSAQTHLSLEDGVLENVGTALQRVRELMVQGLNGTLDVSKRSAIALEIRQQLSTVQALANSKDANGNYLFAGYYEGTTAAFVDNGAGVFTYNGDQGDRALQIGRNRSIAISDHGDRVFNAIPVSAGGVQDMFTVLYGVATDLEADAPNLASLNDIDAALESVLETRASVGARLNAIDGQMTVNDSMLGQIEETKSNVGDLDYAEAASRLNQELLALQAAQQSFVKIEGLSLFNFL